MLEINKKNISLLGIGDLKSILSVNEGKRISITHLDKWGFKADCNYSEIIFEGDILYICGFTDRDRRTVTSEFRINLSDIDRVECVHDRNIEDVENTVVVRSKRGENFYIYVEEGFTIR